MDATSPPRISIVIPAYDEALSIGRVLDEIAALGLDAEVIVVNDGSQDETAQIVRAQRGVRLIEHGYNIGNGAAVKTGIRAARGSAIVLMDADGQHRPADIPQLVSYLDCYDMAVGARLATSDTAPHRDLANHLYNAIASYLVGRPIPDLTSGFRAIRAPVAKRFVYLLPNGFSYPTTITLALFRAGYTVCYHPIVAPARQGRSKIRLLRDGIGFLLTLLRIGTLFVPLRIFLPVAGGLFVLGVGYGIYLLVFWHRFSNMAVLLILSGIMLFMLGLISEQIALLRMEHADRALPEDRG